MTIEINSMNPGVRLNVVPGITASEVVSANSSTTHKTAGRVTVDNPIMSARNVNVFYGDKHAIKDVSLDIARNEVVAMIGPSGCGKSTFLRCLNRMNDTIENCRVVGDITPSQRRTKKT